MSADIISDAAKGSGGNMADKLGYRTRTGRGIVCMVVGAGLLTIPGTTERHKAAVGKLNLSITNRSLQYLSQQPVYFAQNEAVSSTAPSSAAASPAATATAPACS